MAGVPGCYVLGAVCYGVGASSAASVGVLWELLGPRV
jgi:hypothetical protein